MDLAATLGARLQEKQLVMVTAESCTGGWVAKRMTDIAGSSAWFDSGYVSYSNAAKQRMFAVKSETLEAHGAVSEQTVREMVSGVLNVSGADVGVAISGVAGPGGGSPEKPVGTVWFAWGLPEGRVDAAVYHFEGDRDQVRTLAVDTALKGILERL